jgi:polygalacturonase
VSDYGVSPDGEGVIYFGAGEHDAGVIELSSGQTLFIDEGAVVYACVRAIDAENVRIVGRGILDNSRNKEKILYEANVENTAEAVSNAVREHTVQLEYCTGVEIDGITIRDSLVYNIRPIGCESINIRNVKIIGCWRFNSDGIDMHNCVGVRISSCFIRTFDDSVCVKGFDCYYDGDVAEAVRAAMYRGGRAYDVFKDVLVENCVIWNDWGKCLEIGAETKAEEISDVTFRNCDIIHVEGVPLDCCNVDYADVHNVTFRDINIECDETIPPMVIQRNDSDVYVNNNPTYIPRIIQASVVYHHEYSKGSETRRGRNRDILFENINVLGDKVLKVKFDGYDADHKTERITIRNLMRNGRPAEKPEGENWIENEFADAIIFE